MNPLAWSDEHAVGLPDIDADHRALFHIAEQLSEWIENGTAHERLDGVLARLASYAKFHFEAEESLMRRTRFPAYARHRREHESFTSRVSYLKAISRSETADVAAALMEFLRSWIEQHTCGEDHRMIEHVRQIKAVRPPSSYFK